MTGAREDAGSAFGSDGAAGRCDHKPVWMVDLVSRRVVRGRCPVCRLVATPSLAPDAAPAGSLGTRIGFTSSA